jgi:MFS family permease
MSIGPAVGGFLAVVSFPLIFIVDGLTSLAASGLLSILLWYRHRAARENPMPGHAAEHSSARTTRLVWHHRAAMVLFLAVFLVNAVFTQHEGALPVFLVRDLHFRESFYGLLFVVNTLTIVVVEVPLNLAMAHWSPRRVIPIAAVLIATGFGALAFARTPLAIVGTVVIWTFGEMMLFPTVTSYIAELAPSGRTGEYMGVLSATFSLALIVGPWAGGAVLDHFGAVPLWAGSFACAALGAAVFFVLANPPVLRGVR